jgi:hypothetical protein
MVYGCAACCAAGIVLDCGVLWEGSGEPLACLPPAKANAAVKANAIKTKSDFFIAKLLVLKVAL